MRGNAVIKHKERLELIIDQAYILLCNKIAGKEIRYNGHFRLVRPGITL